MYKVVFHSNLDEVQQDIFDLNNKAEEQRQPIIPRKGELIIFSFPKYENWNGECVERTAEYQLEVYSVSYNFAGKDLGRSCTIVKVELHKPSHYSAISIAAWEKWFKKHRHGKDV